MLCRLTIRDFVLVDRLELEFQARFRHADRRNRRRQVDSGRRAGLCPRRTRRRRSGYAPAANGPKSAPSLTCTMPPPRPTGCTSRNSIRRTAAAAPRARQQRPFARLAQRLAGHCPGAVARSRRRRWSTSTASTRTSRCCAAMPSASCSIPTRGCCHRSEKSPTPGVNGAKHAICSSASANAEALARRARAARMATSRTASVWAFLPRNGEAMNDEHKRLAHAVSLAEGARFALATLSPKATPPAKRRSTAVASRLDTLSDYDPSLLEVAAMIHVGADRTGEADLRTAPLRQPRWNLIRSA
jgi:hypothetical protein